VSRGVKPGRAASTCGVARNAEKLVAIATAPVRLLAVGRAAWTRGPLGSRVRATVGNVGFDAGTDVRRSSFPDGPRRRFSGDELRFFRTVL
jgi:hypothetical protein